MRDGAGSDWIDEIQGLLAPLRDYASRGRPVELKDLGALIQGLLRWRTALGIDCPDCERLADQYTRKSQDWESYDLDTFNALRDRALAIERDLLARAQAQRGPWAADIETQQALLREARRAGSGPGVEARPAAGNGPRTTRTGTWPGGATMWRPGAVSATSWPPAAASWRSDMPGWPRTAPHAWPPSRGDRDWIRQTGSGAPWPKPWPTGPPSAIPRPCSGGSRPCAAWPDASRLWTSGCGPTRTGSARRWADPDPARPFIRDRRGSGPRGPGGAARNPGDPRHGHSHRGPAPGDRSPGGGESSRGPSPRRTGDPQPRRRPSDRTGEPSRRHSGPAPVRYRAGGPSRRRSGRPPLDRPEQHGRNPARPRSRPDPTPGSRNPGRRGAGPPGGIADRFDRADRRPGPGTVRPAAGGRPGRQAQALARWPQTADAGADPLERLRDLRERVLGARLVLEPLEQAQARVESLRCALEQRLVRLGRSLPDPDRPEACTEWTERIEALVAPAPWLQRPAEDEVVQLEEAERLLDALELHCRRLAAQRDAADREILAARRRRPADPPAEALLARLAHLPRHQPVPEELRLELRALIAERQEGPRPGHGHPPSGRPGQLRIQPKGCEAPGRAVGELPTADPPRRIPEETGYSIGGFDHERGGTHLARLARPGGTAPAPARDPGLRAGGLGPGARVQRRIALDRDQPRVRRKSGRAGAPAGTGSRGSAAESAPVAQLREPAPRGARLPRPGAGCHRAPASGEAGPGMDPSWGAARRPRRFGPAGPGIGAERCGLVGQKLRRPGLRP